MSKAILMSIQPQWVCEILNGNKTIEVRKKFPKDFVGWVYIYCTKPNKNDYLVDFGITGNHYSVFNTPNDLFDKPFLEENCLNGKVVARFWCDKVERIYIKYGLGWTSDGVNNCTEQIEKESCLSRSKIYEYAKNSCYAIHISKLEIFDKPKELEECMSWFACKDCPLNAPYECHNERCKQYRSVKRPPQNYMFIGEIEDENS